MHPGVTGRVVDKDVSVLFRDCAVGKDHVGHIAYPFLPKGHQEYAGRIGDDLGGVIESGTENVQHIPESGRCIAHAVGDMDPASFPFDGHGASAIFRLGQGVIHTSADDFFLINDRMLNILTEAETDAATAAGLDKSIHRPGIEGVFSIDVFGMQHYISLLG